MTGSEEVGHPIPLLPTASPLTGEDLEGLSQSISMGKGDGVVSLEDLVPGADLAGADLREHDLSEMDLTGCNLFGADLRGCGMQDTILDGAKLQHAKLDGALAVGASFRDAPLEWASTTHAHLYMADFEGAALHETNMHGADIRLANFHEARILGAYGWGGPVLHLASLDSGKATFFPTWDGWKIGVGFWQGTLGDLEAFIGGEDDWPAVLGEQAPIRVSGLEILIELCWDHMARFPTEVDGLAATWMASKQLTEYSQSRTFKNTYRKVQ